MGFLGDSSKRNSLGLVWDTSSVDSVRPHGCDKFPRYLYMYSMML